MRSKLQLDSCLGQTDGYRKTSCYLASSHPILQKDPKLEHPTIHIHTLQLRLRPRTSLIRRRASCQVPTWILSHHQLGLDGTTPKLTWYRITPTLATCLTGSLSAKELTQSLNAVEYGSALARRFVGSDKLLTFLLSTHRISSVTSDCLTSPFDNRTILVV